VVLRTLCCLTLALALGGWSHRDQRASAWGYEWSRADTPQEGARLVLARAAGTDDILLMLACRPGRGAVIITAAGRQGAPAVLELHSGKAWNRYPGVSHTDAQIGAVVVVKLAEIDPLLRAFGSTGKLTVDFDGRHIVTPNAFAPAHDFLKVCRLTG
jgi:hypothetical protein